MPYDKATEEQSFPGEVCDSDLRLWQQERFLTLVVAEMFMNTTVFNAYLLLLQATGHASTVEYKTISDVIYSRSVILDDYGADSDATSHSFILLKMICCLIL